MRSANPRVDWCVLMDDSWHWRQGGYSVRITVLQAAISGVATRADVLALSGRVDAAAAAFEAALSALGVVLAAEAEPPRGWERPARQLCDVRATCIADALGADPGDGLRLRATALLDLPDVQVVESLGDMHDILAAAIEGGAPRYNRGDVRGCVMQYWGTAQTLLAAPATRGFPGHARALGLLRAAELDAVPPGLADRGIEDLAWRFRQAFDAVLAIRG